MSTQAQCTSVTDRPLISVIGEPVKQNSKPLTYEDDNKFITDNWIFGNRTLHREMTRRKIGCPSKHLRAVADPDAPPLLPRGKANGEITMAVTIVPYKVRRDGNRLLASGVFVAVAILYDFWCYAGIPVCAPLRRVEKPTTQTHSLTHPVSSRIRRRRHDGRCFRSVVVGCGGFGGGGGGDVSGPMQQHARNGGAAVIERTTRTHGPRVHGGRGRAMFSDGRGS